MPLSVLFAALVTLLPACSREEAYHSHWLDADDAAGGKDSTPARYPVCLCLNGGADVNIVVDVPAVPSEPNGPKEAPECCVLLPNTKQVGWTTRKPARECACPPSPPSEFSHLMSPRCCKS